MQTPPMPSYPPEPPGRPGFWSTPKKIAAGVVLALVAAGAVTLASQHGSDHASSDDGTNNVASAPEQSPDPTQACVASWNSSNQNKASVGAIDTSGETGTDPTAYVNVGFSTLFPDRCLITIANPSTMYAQQYLEAAGAGWGLVPSWTGTANQLSSSNTNWNARMHNDGTILLQ